MAKFPVPDDFWAVIAPLLPLARECPKGGRPPIPDQAALTGILFVLRTGLPWEDLPHEMGCGSGMSCWRRLRDWQRAGVWRACITPCWSGWTAPNNWIGAVRHATVPA
ncbi:transposase [Methylobacterium sp. WL116]|jgi:transposase|nr:transposase [Methylobacterium sp. WL116]